MKNQKGVTLKALVILFVILLVLVVVSILLIFGTNNKKLEEDVTKIGSDDKDKSTGTVVVKKPTNEYYTNTGADQVMYINDVYNIETLSTQVNGMVNGVYRNMKGALIVFYTQDNVSYTLRSDENGEVHVQEGLYLEENESIVVCTQKGNTFALKTDNSEVTWEVVANPIVQKLVEVTPENNVIVNDDIQDGVTVTVVGRRPRGNTYCTIKFASEVLKQVKHDDLQEAIDMIKSNVPNSINESYKEQDPNANVNTEYQEVAMVQDSVMARFTKKSNGKFVCEIYALEGSNGAIDNYIDNFILTKEFNENDSTYDSYFTNTEEVLIDPGITTLGYKVFAKFTNANRLSIPSTVERISSSLFDNTLLKEIDYDAVKLYIDDSYNPGHNETDNPFMKNTITDKSCVVNIGNNVTEIPNSLFKSANIKELNIGYNVGVIWDYAFYDISNLDILNIPSNVWEIGSHAFENAQIEKLVLNEGIRNIHEYAFNNCFRLKYDDEIFAYDNLYKVEDVFDVNYNNPEINLWQKLVLPDSVEELDKNAFANNKSLLEFTIPESLQLIGVHVFENCDNLEKVYYNAVDLQAKDIFEFFQETEDSMKLEGLFTYQEEIASRVQSVNIRQQELVIGPNVEKIMPYGLSNLYLNTNVLTIPDNVKEIGEYAFALCNNVETINIGSGIEKINYRAFPFRLGTKLKEININAPLSQVIPSGDKKEINNWGLHQGTKVNFTDQSYQVIY